ncbi:hypothetical protein Ahy_A06g030344 isoform A [Arachis hypogaea]|uniref:Uncharacterized protein n=1 Tax=Arachis hypogaea TaxID=3818 RepID=A0A445CVZ2_ARAHY|nr:hypothetical protein Ahy_A06g030344 isoform A [Arachis hypogaea]
MDDIVMLKILLQTTEGVIFVCANPLDIVIPFTLSFEELKGFQTKYVTNEVSMQDMFSVYMETRSQISFIELYIEFEQSKADRNIELEDYNSDSEAEFESNYEVGDPSGDEDQVDGTMQTNVAEVTNALVN